MKSHIQTALNAVEKTTKRYQWRNLWFIRDGQVLQGKGIYQSEISSFLAAHKQIISCKSSKAGLRFSEDMVVPIDDVQCVMQIPVIP